MLKTEKGITKSNKKLQFKMGAKGDPREGDGKNPAYRKTKPARTGKSAPGKIGK